MSEPVCTSWMREITLEVRMGSVEKLNERPMPGFSRHATLPALAFSFMRICGIDSKKSKSSNLGQGF